MPHHPRVNSVTPDRERDVNLFSAAMLQPQPGQPRILVIDGAPGAGRSHALRVLVGQARAAGRVVHEFHGPQTPPDLHDTSDCGDGAAADAPIVAWDDPPWDDPHFTGWLERRARTGGSVCVLTRRGTGGQPVRSVTLELRPLSAEAAEELATSLLGGRPVGELRSLLSVAAGNPRMVTDLIAGLVAEGSVRVDNGIATVTDGRLPRAVSAALIGRLRALSPPARRLVQLASIVGVPSAVTDVAKLLRTTPLELLPALEEALYSELLMPDADDLVFSHELVRRLVAQSIPASLLGWLHAAVRALTAPQASDRREHTSAARIEAARHYAHRFPQQRSASGAELISSNSRLEKGAAARIASLTPGEYRIAALVRSGLTNRQVAARFNVSPNTVHYHLRNIYLKLGVATRLELALLAWPDLVP